MPTSIAADPEFTAPEFADPEFSAPEFAAPRLARAASAGQAWHDGVIVGFDLETTGTDPATASIVTAAVVYHSASEEEDERSRSWLVDPGVPIPEAATAIHGISTDHAREHGADAATAVADIADELEAVWTAGLPLVVFNAAYDLTLMDAALHRLELPRLSSRDGWNGAVIIDPLVIDRAVDRYRRGKRTLQAAAEHYRVLATDAHSAGGDALAACRVARAIAAAHSEIGTASAADLHFRQVSWAAEWAENFELWLRSQGRTDAVIDGTWPMRQG